MKVKSETIMILPDESLIKQFEDYYSSFALPEDYRAFLKKYNGVIPETQVFNSMIMNMWWSDFYVY